MVKGQQQQKTAVVKKPDRTVGSAGHGPVAAADELGDDSDEDDDDDDSDDDEIEDDETDDEDSIDDDDD